MPDSDYPPARFTSDGEHVTAAFSQTLEAGPEQVWAALTLSENLAQWLAPGSIEARVGGRAQLAFVDSGIVIDSLVTAAEPLRLLEYSWSGPGDRLRPVRWSLNPVGESTEVDLTLTIPADEDVARSAAGWAAHLQMLAAALAGAPQRFPFPTFQSARAAFGEQLVAIDRSKPTAVA